MIRTSTLFLFIFFLLVWATGFAQLRVNPMTTAQALAQKLVGTGLTISNVSFTGTPQAAALQ